MDIKVLEPGFSISHAIFPEDLDEVKALGFRSIICHRQPGEAEDHLNDSQLRQAAEAAGIAWVEIPVTPGVYTTEAIEAFGVAIETLPTPILGFCASGRRAVSLWVHNQMQQANYDIERLLQAAHAAGHDLHSQKDSFTQ
jgi:uncharacterized protein (TIGR01244 family)